MTLLNYMQTSEQEQRMRNRFEEMAQEVLETNTDSNDLVAGIEAEYSIIDNNLISASETQRDDIINQTNHTGKELGAHQFEINTPPLELSNFENILQSLNSIEQKAKKVASKSGLHLIRIGMDPFVPIGQIPRSFQESKYKLVPDFHDHFRDPNLDTKLGRIDVGDAAVVGISNSVQFNLQASSLQDAVDKMNRSFMIAPYVIALSNNSRFIDGIDSKIGDTRMFAWELSHDLRTPIQRMYDKETKVGMINTYFRDIRDYFDRIQKGYFILDVPEAALQVGIGLYWKDTRIKFIDNTPIVEFRPISIQPTAEEDVALFSFWLGRLLYSQQINEPLQDLPTVSINRVNAMQFGTKTKFDNGWASKVIPYEIEKAKIGLDNVGIHPFGFDILYNKLQTGTPAYIMAESMNEISELPEKIWECRVK
jgi:hypothetical protein